MSFSIYFFPDLSAEVLVPNYSIGSYSSEASSVRTIRSEYSIEVFLFLVRIARPVASLLTGSSTFSRKPALRQSVGLSEASRLPLRDFEGCFSICTFFFLTSPPKFTFRVFRLLRSNSSNVVLRSNSSKQSDRIVRLLRSNSSEEYSEQLRTADRGNLGVK